MMYGFGMGVFGLLSVLIPVLLIGAGGAVVAVLVRNRRRRIANEDRRSTEVSNDSAGEHAIERASAQSLFRLARRHGERLTVSDVVVELGLSPREAEDALTSLVDSTHVTMEVTDGDRVRFEFPELTESGHDD